MMASDMGRIILEQERELRRYADEVERLRGRLKLHKENLDEAWSGADAACLDDAIDRVNLRLYRISDDMDEIRHDMLKIYQRIEEEEKEAQGIVI